MELAYIIWGLLSKKKNTKLKTENYPEGTTRSEGPWSFPVSPSLNYVRAKTTSYISEFQLHGVLQSAGYSTGIWYLLVLPTSEANKGFNYEIKFKAKF